VPKPEKEPEEAAIKVAQTIS